MSDVIYMIKWEGIPFLFSTLAAAKESINRSYPDHLVVGSGESEGAHVFDVTSSGKIQDRITVTEMTVSDDPIEFPGVRSATRSTANF